MKKNSSLLKKIETFEKLALYGNRKDFLKSLGQNSDVPSYDEVPNYSYDPDEGQFSGAFFDQEKSISPKPAQPQQSYFPIIDQYIRRVDDFTAVNFGLWNKTVQDLKLEPNNSTYKNTLKNISKDIGPIDSLVSKLINYGKDISKKINDNPYDISPQAEAKLNQYYSKIKSCVDDWNLFKSKLSGAGNLNQMSGVGEGEARKATEYSVPMIDGPKQKV